MAFRAIRLVACLLVPVILSAACSQAERQHPAPRYFHATGHSVQGDFLHAFDEMGGLRTFGYPITEPFEQNGRLVQYFEYARLEDHPDDPGGPVVKLGMLGLELGRQHPPLAAADVPNSLDRDSRYYPQLGHAIKGDFLTFFEQNGGLHRFGFPIAEPSVVEGHLVQDFQRARFVWHAKAKPHGRVTLEPIGRFYFETSSLSPVLLDAVPCP